MTQITRLFRPGRLERHLRIHPWRMLYGLVLFFVSGGTLAMASSVDGFTEPYRTIEVAAAETGIVSEIMVREGETVQRGQLLATLDRDVLLALRAIAQQGMDSRGVLNSALAELQLRQVRLEKLQVLRGKGHARQEEVDRAKADLAIAEAQVLSAEEDLLIKKLDYKKIEAQLARRMLRAPLDGVIAKIQKEAGEYVAPNDPYILTLVQLDPLLATFSLSNSQAAQLAVGMKVLVKSMDAGDPQVEVSVPMEGEVEFIAPVTDAESGTVRVKVRIDNRDGKFRSGERCSLDFPANNQ